MRFWPLEVERKVPRHDAGQQEAVEDAEQNDGAEGVGQAEALEVAPIHGHDEPEMRKHGGSDDEEKEPVEVESEPRQHLRGTLVYQMERVSEASGGPSSGCGGVPKAQRRRGRAAHPEKLRDAHVGGQDRVHEQ